MVAVFLFFLIRAICVICGSFFLFPGYRLYLRWQTREFAQVYLHTVVQVKTDPMVFIILENPPLFDSSHENMVQSAGCINRLQLEDMDGKLPQSIRDYLESYQIHSIAKKNKRKSEQYQA